MSIVMKTKMTAAALAVCSVMGMGYSASALADDNSVAFTTTINVDSVNKCVATVAKGAAGTNWALGWSLDNGGVSTIDYSNDAAGIEPLQVVVSINDVSVPTCHLNNMTIRADMGAAVPAGASSSAYKVSTSNGFWRYMPVVAQAHLYTSNDETASVTGNVKVNGADGITYTSEATKQNDGRTDITPTAGWNFGADAVVLSNGYLDNGGYAPLTFNGAPLPVTFGQTGTAEDVNYAVIGVSAIVAKDPETALGVADKEAVVDQEQVTMPFTINVNWA